MMLEPFITVAELGTYLGRSLSGDLPTFAVDAACETVRGYLDQSINLLESDMERLDGTGTDTLLLRQRPSRAVASVIEDDVALTVDTDYFLGYGDILYRVAGRWSRGRGNIVVTYDHGWVLVSSSGSGDVDRVPADIRSVALAVAKRILEAGSVASGGISQETIGSYSYSVSGENAGEAGALLEGEKRVLDRYLAPGVV